MDLRVKVMVEQDLLTETARKAYDADNLGSTIYNYDIQRKAKDSLQ
jgi:hypothetical protein